MLRYIHIPVMSRNLLSMNIYQIIPSIKNSPLETGIIALFLGLFFTVVAPAPVNAWNTLEDSSISGLKVASMQNKTFPFGRLPVALLNGDYTSMHVPASAYNSLPNQTDSTPFITAAGTHTRFGIVAANFLPLGTQITIPELYGNRIFTVEDRMNKRYNKKIDIWMEDYSDARQFGVKNVEIRIYSAN